MINHKRNGKLQGSGILRSRMFCACTGLNCCYHYDREFEK